MTTPPLYYRKEKAYFSTKKPIFYTIFNRVGECLHIKCKGGDIIKKAWDDIKSYVTVFMTLAYIVFTFLGKITPEFHNIFVVIIAFYFGTQHQKNVDKKDDEERG